MKPKSPRLKSGKANHIPLDWKKTLNKNGSFIISYLDESLAREECKNAILKEENEDLKREVEQLRRTVLRIFDESK